MSLLWSYFIFAERLTVWYGNNPEEMAAFWATQRGRYAPLYWTMVVCNFVIPFALLSHPSFQNDRRLRRGVGQRADRHVARALPHHRARLSPTRRSPTAGERISRNPSRS